MADFTTVNTQYNKGTDGTPDWTGTAMNFGGAGGAHEIRLQRTGGSGGASTSSAAWPYILRPGAGVEAVEECWVFTADTTGTKVATYTGGRVGNARMFRLSFDNLGSPASAMQLTAFRDTSETAPSAGTQTQQASDWRNIVNGQATDTDSHSYEKINIYGSGMPDGGSQETPAAGDIGTTLAATSGVDGASKPGAAAWIATWQSAQGWIQYVEAPAVAESLTAFYWYFALVFYVGVNMQTFNGTGVPFELAYTFT